MTGKNKITIFIATILFFVSSMFAIVQAATIEDLNPDPDDHDFGDVGIDNTRDKVFTLTNEHNTDTINIDEVDLGGDDDNQFSVNADDCEGEALNSDEECEIEIRFEPDDEGYFEAELIIGITQDTDDLIIELEGTGEETDNDVDLSDDSLSFANTYVDYYTLEELEVENNGTKLFTIEDITLDGTDEADFEVDDRDCIDEVLAQNQMCTIFVIFSPSTTGAKTAEVVIQIEDDTEEYQVALSGTGIIKQAGITVEPAFRNLGNFEKGEEESFDFRVENDLATDYEVTSVTIRGSNDFKIDEDECDGTELDDGTSGGDVEDSCQIRIDYKAVEGGLVYAVLDINTNDPSNSEFNIPIRVFVEGADEYPDDISGNTFESYIKNLIDLKIVNGFSDGSFRPNEIVTRGQLAKFIFNAFNIVEDVACERFPDIAANHTFYNEITSLKCAGIIAGFSDGNFRSDEAVTRGEVTKFITEAMEDKGIDVDLTKTEEFPDVDDSDKFIIYIAYLSSIKFDGQNIVNGFSDGEFKSKRSTTRGEMSKMIDIAMKYYQDN